MKSNKEKWTFSVDVSMWASLCGWLSAFSTGTQAQGRLPDDTEARSRWSLAHSPNQRQKADSCLVLFLSRRGPPWRGPSSVLQGFVGRASFLG